MSDVTTPPTTCIRHAHRRDDRRRTGATPRDLVLAFNGVSMTFPDGTHALDTHRLRRCTPGEFVTVVGPSGCGKSTLLRIASGLDRRPRRAPSTVDRSSLGYVFQDATLLQWRTVRRNVELFAELEGIAEGRARHAGRPRASQLVGLDRLRGQVPEAALRAGCGCAPRSPGRWCSNPTCSCSTSRSAPLDEITRERLNDELIALFQRQGFGALFITHSISEAVFLSTRVLVMSARPGRIVAAFDVPFAYPRSPELRFDAAFAELAGQVSHALRGAHA